MRKNNGSKTNNQQPLRVLIVDDSENDVLLIIRELKKGGYHPVYERVETASAMQKAIQDKQWDIILCDYKMPTFDAPSALSILEKANIDTPIIIVSGTIGEETAVNCMRLGAHDYILKANFPRLCPAITKELEEADSRNKKKRAEEALRQSEEKHRAILENIEEGYYEINTEGDFLFFNDAMCRILGYSRKEMTGMNSRQYSDKENAKKLFKTFHEVYKTGQPAKGFDWEVIRKDGTQRHIEASVSLLKDSADNPIGFSGIVRDITERIRSEEFLRKSQELYTKLVAAIPDVIIRTDLEGNILFVNENTLKIGGYRREEIEGHNMIKFIAPEDRDEAVRNLMLMMEEKLEPREYKLLTKDGKAVPFEVNGDFLWNKDGTPFGVVHVGRDISERKRIEKIMRENEERLRGITNNLPGIIFQFYAKDSGEYGMSYTSERLMEFLEIKENVDDPFPLFLSRIHEEDRDRFLASIKTATETGTSWNFEGRVAAQSGDQIWFQGLASPSRYEDQIVFNGILLNITENKRIDKELQRTLDSLRKAFGATVQVMISAIEMRDPYTAGHQKRCADIARAIATEMGFPQEKIDGIRMVGTIHDIGKLSVPAEILTKPTKLTKLEFSLIKQHAQSGYEMLKDIESPWPIAEIIYQHHERINGSGYPRNLKGDEILIEARIMAVADVVEAMSSHRPYRAALGIEAAIAEIEQNKGILYDNAVVDACIRLLREKGYQLP
jgi:PAS domain S-box-containing protein